MTPTPEDGRLKCRFARLQSLSMTSMRIAQLVRSLMRYTPAYRCIRLEPPARSAAEAEQLLRRLDWYMGPASTCVEVNIGWGDHHRTAKSGGRVRRFTTARRGRRNLTIIHLVEAEALLLGSAFRGRVLDEAASGKTAIVTSARLAHADLLPWPMKRTLEAEADERRQLLRHALKRFKNSQLYATGPTLDTVMPDAVATDKVSATLRIACNSIVSNPELFDMLRPHVLTFGDPAFHFGDSEYAEVFRSDLRRVLEAHPDLWVVVPAEYYPVLHQDFAGYPRVVPCAVAPPLRFDPSAFHQRGKLLRTGNILTSAMIPLAFGAGGTMELFGCDGRAVNDDGFWQHSNAAQYQHLYSSVVKRHPSFFRDTSYENYYTNHCRRLAAMVSRLEAAGVRVISRTPSHIPCLADRHEVDAA